MGASVDSKNALIFCIDHTARFFSIVLFLSSNVFFPAIVTALFPSHSHYRPEPPSSLLLPPRVAIAIVVDAPPFPHYRMPQAAIATTRPKMTSLPLCLDPPSPLLYLELSSVASSPACPAQCCPVAS
ncbi:hypothetical protein GUJ93_ZPchr0013g33795 [Zizania palustris]|uniref:Uncharacterized protein n=1 Tax=Zizania palustris TaxID=103762 RepID=A0A8J6BZI5_ZIZPA|nr:hypothetical protein GUJ93_ZPchr0013g33795 [Zizania palustris]